MRIACLQFAPQLGDVDQNLNRADAVLSKANPKNIDLLVLPELAFSGYNFKSLKDIAPFLEPTAAGISSLWARTTALKYDCVVTVGYPEKVDITPKWPASPEYYSSAITVNKEGETIANYRKSFLYYTDETWALEGPDGFYDGVVEGLGNVAMGICMDLNPYKFEAPWSAWEFAYHILHRQANIAIIAMAWVTREDARSYSRTPKEPDMETLAYWVARLEPLIRCEDDGEIIIVLANRTGVEGDAVYAGTSAVLGIQSGEVKLYGVLGRGERELLVVDTSNRPQAKLVSDPSIPARTRGPAGPLSGGTSMLGEHRNESCDSRASKGIQSSFDPLIEPEDIQPSIDEILAGGISMSPVEPLSAHVFFGSNPTKPVDRHPLKSTAAENMPDGSQILKSSKDETYQALKSAVNGINRKDSSTPSPEADRFERPSSPKSRNASRTRQAVHQEQALYTHDLAGVELQTKRATSRNGMGGVEMTRGPVPGQALNSSSHAMDIISGSDHEGTESLVPPVASEIGLRPKSTGW
ncbi:Carbon-nitrogen hydrolase [Pseudogymnoascus verrucosus]|uniref:Carbon-nitrogen hydrolase n=1 Tax=Pseudogymnoascus verrucosus TaxID=342668 RepID=A0A1B8GTR0_9PEZI|nr:Carbon-nitrogen hydrolase [Pseudogymnoascus verrucosus]OBT99222.1 Carbon-nitrogen hydrolase [Pseudogymnoascus verrucosus]